MTIDSVAFVVIGRNEGERLRDCLRPLLAKSNRVIYVDSASTDGSPELARELGAIALVLDSSTLLSAARGRNEGFREVRKRFPECDTVQFIDGDCVLAPNWVETALEFLKSHPKAAVACGRRFEAHPDASLYNRLCDEEWNTPVGQAEHSGGDALVRVKAFEQVGGFRSSLKAGEEPEMTSRMRAAGWEIWRLDAPMTEHDARILRFGQWWTRMIRGGFGYAEVWSTTGKLPRRVIGKQLRSAFTWAVAIPLLILLAAMEISEARLLFLIPLAFALQIARIAARRGFSLHAWQSAMLLVTAKIPEAIGALSYFLGRKADRLVDYKAPQ
ncbi:MAG: glycosyltransferase [Sphingomonas sp.]|nr:glycosyltransferase [Sphingomonas sp.]